MTHIKLQLNQSKVVVLFCVLVTACYGALFMFCPVYCLIVVFSGSCLVLLLSSWRKRTCFSLACA